MAPERPTRSSEFARLDVPPLPGTPNRMSEHNRTFLDDYVNRIMGSESGFARTRNNPDLNYGDVQSAINLIPGLLKAHMQINANEALAFGKSSDPVLKTDLKRQRSGDVFGRAYFVDAETSSATGFKDKLKRNGFKMTKDGKGDPMMLKENIGGSTARQGEKKMTIKGYDVRVYFVTHLKRVITAKLDGTAI